MMPSMGDDDDAFGWPDPRHSNTWGKSPVAERDFSSMMRDAVSEIRQAKEAQGDVAALAPVEGSYSMPSHTAFTTAQPALSFPAPWSAWLPQQPMTQQQCQVSWQNPMLGQPAQLSPACQNPNLPMGTAVQAFGSTQGSFCQQPAQPYLASQDTSLVTGTTNQGIGGTQDSFCQQPAQPYLASQDTSLVTGTTNQGIGSTQDSFYQQPDVLPGNSYQDTDSEWELLAQQYLNLPEPEPQQEEEHMLQQPRQEQETQPQWPFDGLDEAGANIRFLLASLRWSEPQPQPQQEQAPQQQQAPQQKQVRQQQRVRVQAQAQPLPVQLPVGIQSPDLTEAEYRQAECRRIQAQLSQNRAIIKKVNMEITQRNQTARHERYLRDKAKKAAEDEEAARAQSQSITISDSD
jgi:hypothetical protein